MKKLTFVALAALALMASVTPAQAFGPLDVDAGLAFNTKYVWRGQVATPDPVMQPSVNVNAFGLTAGVWGNMDLNDVNGYDKKFLEVDWTLGYELSLPKLSLSAGFIYYRFPDANPFGTVDKVDNATTEFYLGAKANVILSPSLTFYQDIDEFKGGYWEARVSHAVAVSPNTNLDLTAGLGLGSKGYIEGYFGGATGLPTVPDVPGNASMTDMFLSASVPFHPAPMFTVTPSLTYSTLSGDVKDIVDAADGVVYHGKSDSLVAGISAAFSF